MAGDQSAWDKELPCSLRRTLRENWCLDLKIPMPVQIVSRDFSRQVASLQVSDKRRSAQVKVPVGKPQIFVADL